MASRTGASMGPWAEGVGRVPQEDPHVAHPSPGQGSRPLWPVQLGESMLDLDFRFLEDKARPSPSLSLYVRSEREPKLLKEGMVDLQV